MFNALFILSVIGAIVELVRESCEKEVPDEYCANMELYYKDIVDGVPLEQCMNNLYGGKYVQKNKKTT